MGIGSPKKIERHTNVHTMGDIDQLARAMSDAIMHKPIPLVEQALLWGYINIAPGVKLYPEATRLDRACLLLALISTDIVERMQKVADLSDAEVEAQLQAATQRTM